MRYSFYVGLYTLDDVETKVLVDVSFGPNWHAFTIYEQQQAIRGRFHRRGLFAGSYQLFMDNEMHLTLHHRYVERIGVDRIVFYRVESYDPIDPSRWLPDLYPY